MKKRGTNPDGSKLERRKSHRFPVSVPVEASWREADGKAVQQDGLARQVNANGGFLEMSTYPEVGSRLTLVNLLSAETTEARVLATPYSREGVSQGIAIELVVPSDSFWGVNLQVKRTNLELQRLEDCLRVEGIDVRLLKEFRDAIDCVHTTCQTVHRLREVQLHGGDVEDVLSSVTTERLRRAANLCLGILTDIEAGRVDADAKSLDEFSRCVEALWERLRGGGHSPVVVSKRGSNYSKSIA
jgi:hypothetical protein